MFIMKPENSGKRSFWWAAAFAAIPVFYLLAQFLPYYHTGDGTVTTLGAFFWQPEKNTQTIAFLAKFYENFKPNDLMPALLVTQLAAFFLIAFALILKARGIVAIMSGAWGLYGLFYFLTTRSLAFSPVLVYGGIASIIMLFLFTAAVAVSAVFMITMYINYRKLVSVPPPDNAESSGHTL